MHTYKNNTLKKQIQINKVISIAYIEYTLYFNKIHRDNVYLKQFSEIVGVK